MQADLTPNDAGAGSRRFVCEAMHNRSPVGVKGGPDDCATGAPRARPVRLSERTPFLPRYALGAELGNHAYDARHDPPVARKVTLASSEECTFCGPPILRCRPGEETDAHSHQASYLENPFGPKVLPMSP